MLSPGDLALLADVGLDPPEIRSALEGVGGPIERFEGLGDDGAPYPGPGVIVRVPSDRVGETIVALRESLGGLGVGVYHTEQNFGFEPDGIAVLTSDDPYDFLRLVRVDGINHGLEHRDVMAKLREWDARLDLDFTGGALDWVQANLGREPEDWSAFAEEVYRFCPDVVDQGTETVEALAREMRSRRSLYCWWD